MSTTGEPRCLPFWNVLGVSCVGYTLNTPRGTGTASLVRPAAPVPRVTSPGVLVARGDVRMDRRASIKASRYKAVTIGEIGGVSSWDGFWLLGP
jgi:hypothetical protein